MGFAGAFALVSALAQIPANVARPPSRLERDDALFAPSIPSFQADSDGGPGSATVIFPAFRAASSTARLMSENSFYNENVGDGLNLPPAAAASSPYTHSGRMVEIVFIRPPPPRPPDPGIRPADVDLPLYKEWLALLLDSPRPRRAQAYLSDLKKIFVAEGLPEELVWLAEAESNFDPRALNASGARGLFQLMPYTAKERGLRLHPQDERDDPHKNARAAAEHLRHLYGKFDSWSLALAAYNAGEGHVRRSLKAADALTYGEIAEALPLETRVYVAKTLAIMVVREELDAQELDVILGH